MYLNLPPYLGGEQVSCGPNLRNLGAGLSFESSVLLWNTPLDSRLQPGHLGISRWRIWNSLRKPNILDAIL